MQERSCEVAKPHTLTALDRSYVRRLTIKTGFTGAHTLARASMPPPGVKPAATRKSITDQLLAGDIPRDQARAAIESGNIDGAIDAYRRRRA